MYKFKWLAVNTAFLATVYYGIFEDIEGIRNLMYALVYVSAISNIAIHFLDDLEYMPRTMSRSISLTLDMFVLGIFIYSSFWVTALIYLIGVASLEAYWNNESST